MAQASHPMFINLPPPVSNPDTPSEMPGTPTSTTTSLSALSTTAIKDGHRGHLPGGFSGRGHAHQPSTTSLEAERADRISRLAGLERVSTLRAAPNQGGPSSLSPQTTPTSTTGFPPNFPQATNLTPAYFDAHGQPVAATKMSTVGTASATASYAGDDVRTTAGDQDEDILSMDTNYREADSVTSMGAEADQMDEDLDGMASRSVAGYDDRMSDDGSASLVGFGEGAGSTVSGPIYHRRPIPGMTSVQGGGVFGLERSGSGLSDGIPSARLRDLGVGSDTPVSAAALQERREARIRDGITNEGPVGADDELFVDTTLRGPVPISQSQRPQQTSGQMPPTSEAVERMMRERLDDGEAGLGRPTMGSPKGSDRLGQFYFEGAK